MENTVELIKNKVLAYQSLLSKKEEIEKNFNSWHELYDAAQKELIEIEELYEKNKPPEMSKTYDESIIQEKEYLAVICEITKELDEVNKELGITKPTDEEIEYVMNLNRFQILSDKMKEIEKHSKKMVKRVEPEYFFPVPNAEGRNKKIFSPLVDDYKKLSEEKRALAKILRKQRDLVIYQTEENEVVEIEETAAKAFPKTPVVEERTVNSSKSYSEDETIAREKMLIELENKELEQNLEEYKKVRGKKHLIPVYGEKVWLNPKMESRYRKDARKIKLLKEQLEALKNKGEVVEEENVDDNAKRIEAVYSDSSMYIKDGNMDIPSEDPFEGFTSDLFKQKVNPDEKWVPTFEDEQFDRENEALFAMVNKHHDEVVAKELEEAKKSKPKGFMKIKKIKKPMDKEKLKDTIKRAAIGIAAGIFVLTCATVSTLLQKLHINKNDIPDFPEDEIVSQLDKEDLDKDMEDKFDFSSTESTIVEEKEFIKLGDKFNVNNNSKIYNTMYDATLMRAGERPYFSAEYERTVGGLAINYEGQLYFFYSNDAAAQENVDMLLANGGKITSVLGENASGYEGFYNIEDVKSLSNTLGGNVR